MEQARWEKIKDLLEQALELTSDQRATFLAQACGDDAGLRSEVEALLDHDLRAGSFLQGSPVRDSGMAMLSSMSTLAFSPGEVISGRFQIARFIGRGGMGEVYEARDLELGARIALKTLRPEISADSWALSRFKQEVQLARRVTHPNVCRMFDIARHRVENWPKEADRVFITMELLDGESLAERLRRRGQMTMAEAVPIIRQMAEALQAAHEVGVIHRDFKPSNVVLANTGTSARSAVRTVVTDFGLARAAVGSSVMGESLMQSLSVTGQVLGTLAYMAPEQLEGGNPTPATDVYALGLVIYEMLTGHTPFPEDAPLAGAFLRLKEEPPSPRTHLPQLDAACEQAIMQCLRTDPSARFQSAKQALAGLVPQSGAYALPLRSGLQRVVSKARSGIQRVSRRRLVSALVSMLLTSVFVGIGLWRLGQRVYTRSIAGTARTFVPVPQIAQPLEPPSIAPGENGVKLRVNGTGFVSSSVIEWNGKALPTKFISTVRLEVAVPPAEIPQPGTARISVRSGAGAPASDVVFLPISKPTPSLYFARAVYPAGDEPYAVAAADFNGDGKTDLLVVNRSVENLVHVLLGKGDGTFGKAMSYETGPVPSAVAVGDFNDDGKMDVATANFGDGTVSVLLGKGDGTFQTARTYDGGAGAGAISIAVGDFNQDGKADIVLANSEKGNFSVLLGNGDGTFRTPVKYGPFVNPSAVAVGDFNSDGKLDLVVTNSGSSTISVLLGNGNGTFRKPISSPAGNSPSSVVVADFNGDGKPDVALTNRDTNTISILLGKGDGTFQGPVTYGVTYYPQPIIAGDFYGDGKLDLAVVNGFVGTVSILPGNGDGTFQRAQTFDAGTDASSLAAGDFNGDGRLDLAVTNYANPPGTVSILLQAPAVQLRTEPIDLGDHPLGRTIDAPPWVALSNDGSSTLLISSIGFAGPNAEDFSQTNDCGTSLAAGATCIIQVTFRPSKRGARSARLVITDNAAGSPHGFRLTGIGVEPSSQQ